MQVSINVFLRHQLSIVSPKTLTNCIPKFVEWQTPAPEIPSPRIMKGFGVSPFCRYLGKNYEVNQKLDP